MSITDTSSGRERDNSLSNKNPWKISNHGANSSNSANISFEELMSEDVAKDLQKKEELQFKSFEPESIADLGLNFSADSDTSSDFLLAVALQEEFNKEHNKKVQLEEKHHNKNSKVSLSFSKYKIDQIEESDSEDDFYLDDENRALDSFEESRRTDPVIPAKGYTVHNNKIVTKHDTTISARKNAEKVMSLPPGFNTGDGGGFDMQISNKVYNKLARSALTETKRKQKIRDKVDKATSEKALDPKTRLILFKMVNNSVLESVNGIVSTGKESVVFHATGGVLDTKTLPPECAVKIFKTTLTDFKTRERYIRDDHRFKDRISKNNNRMVIKLWAEKEFHNLRRLNKASIPSPTPILIKKHVLVMAFIGANHAAAPKLKHVQLSDKLWLCAYEQVVQMMIDMYTKCRLVHADLSEYNILWHDEQCHVIDLGQAVEPTHPSSLAFLYRDCSNIARFFNSKGVADVKSPISLFKAITSIDLPPNTSEDEAAIMIKNYDNESECQRGGQFFDAMWKEIEKQKSFRRNDDQLENELA